MNYGMLLLNKIVEQDDVKAIARHGLEPTHFATEGERDVLRFIREYAVNNAGKAPSYAVVVEECEAFDYVPQVDDSYEYLTGQVKAHAAKTQLMAYLQNDFSNAFNAERDGAKLIEQLQAELTEIKRSTMNRAKVGTDITRDAEQFIEEYSDRKDGKSFKLWRSKFPTINNEIGGYFSGNMYTWYARSGRGKSVITMEEVIEAAAQGANVLVWAMEMSRFEWMARAYSSLSARAGVLNTTINGIDYDAGFENRQLLTGKLTPEFEQGLRDFVVQLAQGDHIDGRITLRAADDADFVRRNLAQLEADIEATKADVILIDAIYLMDYEANTSKTAGGDVANTSKLIRRLAGTTKTVVHVITQADEVKDDQDAEGNRELKAPKRAEIKKTKQVLEDAANVFGIDSLDGQGIIEIGKGRSGGEGALIELTYLPNYGIVKEAIVSPDQFGF
jgi:replicative DNA helicase